jgi:UDP-N-acetylmuramoyl-tripeptide--D-alanyl-D-alanine ligase
MMRATMIALWTHGQLMGADIDVGGVSIDTRKIKPGDLFVAIKGERVDGHDFVAQAAASGAAAALVTRKVNAPSWHWVTWPVRYAHKVTCRWLVSPARTARPR